MTKIKVERTLVEESTVSLTRSSPRRRKREADRGTDGLDTSVPPPKRTKQEAKQAAKKEEETAGVESNLQATQSIVNGDSHKSTRRRRPAPIDQLAEQPKARSSRATPALRVPHGDAPEPPIRKRKGKPAFKEDTPVVKQSNGTATDKKTKVDAPAIHERKAKRPVKKTTPEADTDLDGEADKPATDSTPKNPKRRRKTAEEKALEAMPLAARTTGLRMFVGAHVSIAKGLQNSITNSVHIGGNAFALFLKSQRKWENAALTDESQAAFRSHLLTHQYDAQSHILPHGSYLVNLAIEDADRAKQAYDAFLDDLHRCERLGIKLYNFHPGAAGTTPLNEAIQRIADNLNCALSATKIVTPVLENMAGSGTVIGSRFSDLHEIISRIKPEFQSRIGVCLDTCHAFAAGYDLRTPESFKAVLDDFDQTVGIKYLRALHLNDSKAPLGSKKDLHQNIGLGFLGLRAFHNVMNESRFEGLPLILETPCERPDPEDPSGKKTVDDKGVWAREIKLLEGLIGMDVESAEFRGLEEGLSEQGRGEREKMEKAIKGRETKAREKVERGQRRLEDMLGRGAGQGKGKKGKENKGEKRVENNRDGESSGEDSELTSLDSSDDMATIESKS